jgi:hypothetical protein
MSNAGRYPVTETNPNFASPEIFKAACNKFFLQCDQNKKTYTIGKLCCFLGLDRTTFNDLYNKDTEFSQPIKWAREMCEADQEAKLVDKETFCNGLIFALKNNHKWVDKTEVDSSHSFPDGINVRFTRPPSAPSISPELGQ